MLQWRCCSLHRCGATDPLEGVGNAKLQGRRSIDKYSSALGSMFSRYCLTHAAAYTGFTFHIARHAVVTNKCCAVASYSSIAGYMRVAAGSACAGGRAPAVRYHPLLRVKAVMELFCGWLILARSLMQQRRLAHPTCLQQQL